MTRDELVEVGSQALPRYGAKVHPLDIAADVIDAVEPLICADERNAAWQEGYLAGQADTLADLRAKVEELRARPIASFDGYTGRDALDQVLVLLDGKESSS